MYNIRQRKINVPLVHNVDKNILHSQSHLSYFCLNLLWPHMDPCWRLRHKQALQIHCSDINL